MDNDTAKESLVLLLTLSGPGGGGGLRGPDDQTTATNQKPLTL